MLHKVTAALAGRIIRGKTSAHMTWLQGFLDKLEPELAGRFAGLLGETMLSLPCRRVICVFQQPVVITLYHDWYNSLVVFGADQALFQAGDLATKQGDVGDSMFVVSSGCCSLTTQSANREEITG